MEKAVRPCFMASGLKGPVRFRFRFPDEDVDVRIEGDANWVLEIRKQLELDQIGWIQPLAINSSSHSDIDFEFNGNSDDSSLPNSLIRRKPKDMGPPPDPDSIPVVRRPIGSLDLESELAKLGLDPPTKPTSAELAIELEGVEEPLPAQGPMVTDPMAEAWLRELMDIAVRTHALTALTVEMIENSASSLLGDKSGLELELWLENLFRQSKLVKVHGGDQIGYGPSPAWLAGRIG